MGHGIALEKSTEMLLSGTPDLTAIESTGTLIENFNVDGNGAELSNASPRSIRTQFQNEEWVSLIDKQYKYVLNRTFHSAKVALGYAQFCLVRASFRNVDTSNESSRALSRSIVSTSYFRDTKSKLKCAQYQGHTVDKRLEKGFVVACAVHKNAIEVADRFVQKEDMSSTDGEQRAMVRCPWTTRNGYSTQGNQGASLSNPIG